MSVLTDVAFWVSSAVCVLSLAHAPIFALAMRWHKKNVGLISSDYEQYVLRWALPPWYVRYTSALLRRPVDPLVLNRPREPQDIRVVDVNGAEIAPTRVVYLGPDPDGTNVFEAYFPPDVQPQRPPHLKIGMLPGKTAVMLRFEVE